MTTQATKHIKKVKPLGATSSETGKLSGDCIPVQ